MLVNVRAVVEQNEKGGKRKEERVGANCYSPRVKWETGIGSDVSLEEREGGRFEFPIKYVFFLFFIGPVGLRFMVVLPNEQKSFGL